MDGPVVRTASGAVRGVWRGNSAAFLGMPYAAAPFGSLRFAAPGPVEPWGGIRDATTPGATPQRRRLGLEPSFPEPCVPGDETLNVNVYTPAPGQPERGLPVLVWIHGGGFTAGSIASPWYDGRSFSRDGVVLVTISYRLGFDGFGWLEDAPLNRGILDQIAALEWVRDNIAAFGGDPASVTIAGQSAGGNSVMTLLTAPRAQSLFRAAISQSAGPRVQWPDSAEAIGRQLAQAAGVPPTREGWSQLSEADVLDVQGTLRVGGPPAPIDPVFFARVTLAPAGELSLPFGPVIDGELVPHPVADAVHSGVGADKPLLVGVTAHEFALWLLPAGKQLADVDMAAVLTEAGLSAGAAADFVRSHADLSNQGALLGQLMAECMFRVPLLRLAEARAPRSGDKTWLYDFRWRSPTYEGLSAHCLELPFVWDLLDADGVARTHGQEPPQQLAEAAHAAWVRFARDGDPGWRPWSKGVGMVFDTDSTEAEILGLERRLAAALSQE